MSLGVGALTNILQGVMFRAAEAGLFVAPNSAAFRKSYGLFTMKSFKPKDPIITVGNYDISHSSMCRQVGIEPAREYGESSEPIAKQRSARHVLSYIQNLKEHKSKRDFGSYKNRHLKWCDLVRNESPVIYLNSVNRKNDPRRPNISFEVLVDKETNEEFCVIQALQNINIGEELLSDYLQLK